MMHLMNTHTHDELQANAAIAHAVKALRAALEASTLAQHGSQVLGPLGEALEAATYACDVAEGRL